MLPADDLLSLAMKTEAETRVTSCDLHMLVAEAAERTSSLREPAVVVVGRVGV